MKTRIQSSAVVAFIGVAAISIMLMALRSRGQVDSVGGGQPNAANPPAAVVPTPPPMTKLEKLANQSGIVVLKGYTVVGELAGDDGSSVQVTAVHFSDAASPSTHQSGIVVQVREAGNARQTLTYIDEDEIPALLDALQTLGRLQGSDVSLQQYEARYSTRANLELANIDVSGGRMLGVRGVQYLPFAGQVTTAVAQFRVSRVTELGQLFGNAKKILDTLGSK